MFFVMLLLVMLLFMVLLFLLASVFECLDFVPNLLHFQGVLKDLVASLKLLLLDIDHWVLHHLEEGLVLTRGERVMGLLRLKTRLLRSSLLVW